MHNNLTKVFGSVADRLQLLEEFSDEISKWTRSKNDTVRECIVFRYQFLEKEDFLLLCVNKTTGSWEILSLGYLLLKSS